jgi:hypothetical protein
VVPQCKNRFLHVLCDVGFPLCDLVFAFRSEPRSTHFRLLDFLHRLIRPVASLVFFDQCTRCRLHFLFRLFLQSPWSHRSFSILPLSPVSFGRWWLSLPGALFSLVPFLCVLADLFSCALRAVDPVSAAAAIPSFHCKSSWLEHPSWVSRCRCSVLSCSSKLEAQRPMNCFEYSGCLPLLKLQFLCEFLCGSLQ